MSCKNLCGIIGATFAGEFNEVTPSNILRKSFSSECFVILRSPSLYNTIILLLARGDNKFSQQQQSICIGITRPTPTTTTLTASFSSVELYLKSNFLDDETFKEDERDSVGVMMDNGSP